MSDLFTEMSKLLIQQMAFKLSSYPWTITCFPNEQLEPCMIVQVYDKFMG